MKRNLYWIAVISSFVFVAACGSSSSDTSSTTGGTVIVQGGSSASAAVNKDDAVSEGTPTSCYVRMYGAAISTDATCHGDFITLQDDTANASDCTTTLTDLSNFKNMMANQQFLSKSGVTAGSYACIKFDICDYIKSSGPSTAEHCNSDNIVFDTYGTETGGTAAAEVIPVYFSTTGSSADSTMGTADNPHMMTSAIVVTDNAEVVVHFIMDLTDKLMYDPNDGSCYAGVPTMLVQ